MGARGAACPISTVLDALPHAATRLAYRRSRPPFGCPSCARSASFDGPAPSDRALASAIRRRHEELLERDLANVEEGLYPARLLFQMPLGEYARARARFVADLPRSARLARLRAFRDLPQDLALDDYPAYYRRTFQPYRDGWFDAVVSVHLFHELPKDLAAMLDEGGFEVDGVEPCFVAKVVSARRRH